MAKVNLFIVGAMKAGTTTLAEVLGRHPEIYASPIKEPNFFCSDLHNTDFFTGSNENNLDIDEYLATDELRSVHGAVVNDREAYRELFVAGRGSRYLLDASISYLLSEVAAQNIFENEPESKIIIGLRNPVERAFSEFCMRAGLAGVTESFSDLIKREAALSHEAASASPSTVIKAGFYYRQVKRYLDVFPRENIFFFNFDDLKSDPNGLFQEVFRFLGVDSVVVASERGHNNASVLPSNQIVHNFLVKTGLFFVLRTLFPGKLKDVLKGFYYSSRPKKAISEADLAFLKELYASDLRCVENITGLDLSGWVE